MPNPQNITDLNTKRTPAERKAAASKAGKASGKKRAAYANLRECFTKEMTEDDMKKLYKKMLELVLVYGNINAFDKLVQLTDTGAALQNHVTITFASEEMEEYGD